MYDGFVSLSDMKDRFMSVSPFVPMMQMGTGNGFGPWLNTKCIALANQVYKHMHLASYRHSISSSDYQLIWMATLVKNKSLDARNLR